MAASSNYCESLLEIMSSALMEFHSVHMRITNENQTYVMDTDNWTESLNGAASDWDEFILVGIVFSSHCRIYSIK